MDIDKLRESIEGKGKKPYMENDNMMGGGFEGVHTMNREN